MGRLCDNERKWIRPRLLSLLLRSSSSQWCTGTKFLNLCRFDGTRSVSDEPGCRQFDVNTGAESPDGVLLYEVYDDAAAFEAHKLTPHYKEFAAGVERFGVQIRSVRLFDRQHPSAAVAHSALNRMIAVPQKGVIANLDLIKPGWIPDPPYQASELCGKRTFEERRAVAIQSCRSGGYVQIHESRVPSGRRHLFDSPSSF